ncbi:hypothetical protein LF1_50710 [Rubripirellula obstinata]|uniref:Uncharacterized protein n=1 Tax=Rubripirellula obstinata TaxID=406547 RepID=A0A5B1CPL6_9BACT|nr:hypothetical protein [Rubripirellula obstinata]KAA1262506.1 hypothetical protein LF1_50710 [Rubripirellula obstinata]
MRHPSFTLLSLAAIVFVASGCRQTNGTTTGPLTPLGGLSPVTPGQAPILGPFGGATRVTPPPTGSFSPAGTLGTIAPAPGYGPPANYAPQVNAGAFNQPIGSGVQPVSGFDQPAINQHASWTETGTTIASGGSPQARDPRAGGMQIIDLTRAPDPPNYRPPNYRPPAFQSPQVNSGASPIISPSMMPANPSYQSPQQLLQPMDRSSLSAAPFPTTSPQFESRNPIVGGTLAPLPRSQQPRLQQDSASTARLSSPPADSSLNWRRPGTQF